MNKATVILISTILASTTTSAFAVDLNQVNPTQAHSIEVNSDSAFSSNGKGIIVGYKGIIVGKKAS